MGDPEEVLDLVDANDIVIGQVPRSAFADPAHFPAGNMRAAEHVGTGESYETAMIRGLQEELNMTVPPDELIFLGKLPPDNLPIFRSVYKLQRNEPAKNTVISAVRAFF